MSSAVSLLEVSVTYLDERKVAGATDPAKLLRTLHISPAHTQRSRPHRSAVQKSCQADYMRPVHTKLW